jgi:hypothetical protein
VSFAGLSVGAVKVSEGRDSAAAHTLDVEELVPVGEETELLWPWRGVCRCSCRAFARAFS